MRSAVWQHWVQRPAVHVIKGVLWEAGVGTNCGRPRQLAVPAFCTLLQPLHCIQMVYCSAATALVALGGRRQSAAQVQALCSTHPSLLACCCYLHCCLAQLPLPCAAKLCPSLTSPPSTVWVSGTTHPFTHPSTLADGLGPCPQPVQTTPRNQSQPAAPLPHFQGLDTDATLLSLV